MKKAYGLRCWGELLKAKRNRSMLWLAGPPPAAIGSGSGGFCLPNCNPCMTCRQRAVHHPLQARVTPIARGVAGALVGMGEGSGGDRRAADCSMVGRESHTTPAKKGGIVGLELGLGKLEVEISATWKGLSCKASQPFATPAGQCW